MRYSTKFVFMWMIWTQKGEVPVGTLFVNHNPNGESKQKSCRGSRNLVIDKPLRAMDVVGKGKEMSSA